MSSVSVRLKITLSLFIHAAKGVSYPHHLLKWHLEMINICSGSSLWSRLMKGDEEKLIDEQAGPCTTPVHPCQPHPPL